MKNILLFLIMMMLISCTQPIKVNNNLDNSTIEGSTMSPRITATIIKNPTFTNVFSIEIDGIFAPLSPKVAWQYKGIVEQTFYTIYFKSIRLSGGIFVSNNVTLDDYYGTPNMEKIGWHDIGGVVGGTDSKSFFYNWEINRYLIVSQINDIESNLSYYNLWLSLDASNIPTPQKLSSMKETN